MMSSLRLLVERELDVELEQYVRERRSAGDSWRRVAASLLADTQIDVHPETLRLWFRGTEVAA